MGILECIVDADSQNWIIRIHRMTLSNKVARTRANIACGPNRGQPRAMTRPAIQRMSHGFFERQPSMYPSNTSSLHDDEVVVSREKQALLDRPVVPREKGRCTAFDPVVQTIKRHPQSNSTLADAVFSRCLEGNPENEDSTAAVRSRHRAIVAWQQ